ncbi:MAG: signal peptide peptidase SppA [Candidatus Anstonellales archaeon]
MVVYNKSLLTIVGFILFIAIVVLLAILTLFSSSSSPISDTECIAEYRIFGELTFPEEDVERESIFSEPRISLSEIISDLNKINNDKKAKALLLKINSPGGGVYQTKEIFSALKKFNKPIVVYYSELGTSGAYYIGLPAKFIIAHPNAIIGSIGVRLDNINIVGLLEKIGVNITTYKSGKYKDLLSSTRNLTKEEEDIVIQIIKDIYSDFVNDVKEFRGSKISDNDAYEAKIYTGKQALNAGLVDQIGSLEDARKKAFELANLTYDEKKICNYEKKKKASLMDLFASSFYMIGKYFAKGFSDGLKPDIGNSDHSLKYIENIQKIKV